MLGKRLIIIGIVLAILPYIILGIYDYYTGDVYKLAVFQPFTLFIVGIIIAIIGEVLKAKGDSE
jgi:hypothetical protein